MGRLYIANVSLQRQIVCYRLDINKKGEIDPRLMQRAALQEVIESGRQVTIGGDLHPDQISAIIDQLSEYGMVGEVDVPNKLFGIHNLVFNIDRPVSRHVLEELVAYNKGLKLDDGTLRRQRAAIIANQQLTNQIGEAPPEFDVEFEAEEVSELDEKRIEEGFHVVAKPGDPPKAPRRRAA